MRTRDFEPIKNGDTILNTFIEEEEYREAFEDYAEYSGLTIKGDTAYDCDGNEVKTLYEYAEDCIAWESEEFWDGLKKVRDSAYIDYYVVTGSLGLWNGTYPGICETFDNLYDALSKCAGDAYDIVVKHEDNAIHFECHHHDGVNIFDVYNLSFDDYDKVTYWEDNEGNVFDYIEKHAKPITWQMIGQ